MNKTVRRAVLRSRANSEYHSKYRKPLVTAVEHNKHNREVTNSSSCATIDIKDENNLNKPMPTSVKQMFGTYGTFGTYNSKGDYMPYFTSRMTNEELAAYFAEYTTQQLEAEARGNSSEASEDGDSDRVEAVSQARLGLLRAELQRRDWMNKNK